jgi:SAM-dependent methyltransferase
MTRLGVDVLRSRDQIVAARARMRGSGISRLSPAWLRWLARHRLWRGPVVGDWLKSWDVELTLARIRDEIPTDAPIVDMGSYGCEVLPALAAAGYRDLLGIDLEPRLLRFPAPKPVRYRVGDFMAGEGADGTAAAVTSISVMEHGFDAGRLAAAVSRWLRPGGCFLASFDYWPDRIETSQVRLFGLSWTIFSRGDIESFLDVAARHGLHPDGEVRLEADRPVIHFERRDYTFGWMALRKT